MCTFFGFYGKSIYIQGPRENTFSLKLRYAYLFEPSIQEKSIEKGYYNNIVKELRTEDTGTYKEMIRMDHESFLFIFFQFEKDITPMRLAKGGLSKISPPER